MYVGHALYACRQPNTMGNAENSPIEVEFSDGTHAMRALRTWFKQCVKLQFRDTAYLTHLLQTLDLPEDAVHAFAFRDPVLLHDLQHPAVGLDGPGDIA